MEEDKNYSIPQKTCPKDGEKMSYKLVNKIGDYIWVEYTCSRKNCIYNHHPKKERIKVVR